MVGKLIGEEISVLDWYTNHGVHAKLLLDALAACRLDGKHWSSILDSTRLADLGVIVSNLKLLHFWGTACELASLEDVALDANSDF